VDVGECPEDPAVAQLNIKPTADGAEPAPAALASGRTQIAISPVAYCDGVGSPRAIAAATFDVKTGPAIHRCRLRRTLKWKIRGVCRLGNEHRDRRAQEHVHC